MGIAPRWMMTAAVAAGLAAGCGRAAKTTLASWTPAEIAARPQAYLTFCRDLLDATVRRAQASAQADAEQRAQITARRAAAARDVDLAQRVLAELKPLYASAARGHAWPVLWKGQLCTEDWARTNIERIYSQMLIEQSTVAIDDRNLAKLQQVIDRLPDLESKARLQRTQVDGKLDDLKISQANAALGGQLQEMGAGIAALVNDPTVAGPAAVDLSNPATMGPAAASAAAADDHNFQHIMDEK